MSIILIFQNSLISLKVYIIKVFLMISKFFILQEIFFHVNKKYFHQNQDEIYGHWNIRKLYPKANIKTISGWECQLSF